MVYAVTRNSRPDVTVYKETHQSIMAGSNLWVVNLPLVWVYHMSDDYLPRVQHTPTTSPPPYLICATTCLGERVAADSCCQEPSVVLQGT
jgi:hypothetical protein